MLTKHQKQLLAFLDASMRAGVVACPTYEEMRQHMGFSSMSAIHRLLLALEVRGFI